MLRGAWKRFAFRTGAIFCGLVISSICGTIAANHIMMSYGAHYFFGLLAIYSLKNAMAAVMLLLPLWIYVELSSFRGKEVASIFVSSAAVALFNFFGQIDDIYYFLLNIFQRPWRFVILCTLNAFIPLLLFYFSFRKRNKLQADQALLDKF